MIIGKHLRWLTLVAIVLGGLAAANAQAALGTGFTCQGQLMYNNLPISGAADFRFSLWDDVATPPGNPIGSTIVFDLASALVNVDNGLLTVTLDFGEGAFTGEDRWLKIETRSPSWDGAERRRPAAPVTCIRPTSTGEGPTG